MEPKTNQKGQVTIFFSTCLLLLVTFLAFVINIGIFVKAKINLQNAVDAAAWSGAAVQSRQLTNIGYLNWEMRNVYKEWMFKYYILGNLSIKDVRDGPGDNVKYTMESVQGGLDTFNFPSVCIHFGGSQVPNICRTYRVPGVPLFAPHNSVGIDQTTEVLIDTIITEKGSNCTDRAAINFLATNLWAYNIPFDDADDESLQNLAPAIASNRMGALPQAFELAVRIRNLEAQVNKAPYSKGVCIDQGNAASSCGQSINELLTTEPYASNERINKAFYAGYRNLGNGSCNDPNDTSGRTGDSEMKCSFTLTEIPPKPHISTVENSLSNILIPDGVSTKYYVDLKIHLLNLATFYTAFATTVQQQNINGNMVTSSGQCDATKIALPIPGYPFGFIKNPDVLTYYAVKGEASFVGMFNPFNFGGNGIKLTAYAAAKPFGGRIGPRLFLEGEVESTVIARTDNAKTRSSGYLSALSFANTLDANGNPTTTYSPGMPVPSDLPGNSSTTGPFWMTDSGSTIGGWIGESEIRFAIPNLVYDYPVGPTDSSSYQTDDQVQILTPGFGDDPSAGLYNGAVFTKFRNNFPDIQGVVSSDNIEDAILSVRAPTQYDVNNYLIPTTDDMNSELGIPSFAIIGSKSSQNSPVSGTPLYDLKIYAPLYEEGTDALYQTTNDVLKELNAFIANQTKAVSKYRISMNKVAQAVYDKYANLGPDGAAAASGFSDINYTTNNFEGELPSCNSMAGKFVYFYTGDSVTLKGGDTTNCPTPFPELARRYWSEMRGDTTGRDRFYNVLYRTNDTVPNKNLYSAYRPGPTQGASTEGSWKNTIDSKTHNLIRNFYSTKFVSVSSLLSGGSFDTTGFPFHSEGNKSYSALNDIKRKGFTNSLNPQGAQILHDLRTFISH